MQNILLGILLISCVVVIISTMLMEPKAEGMGSISGSAANVFGKTASRGKEKLLSSLTWISGVVFVITTILLAIIK
ncbi:MULTISPECIES: preprotein translocase subunit SecG [Helcococcus]|uniref:Protein-export membrane protein SecG n=1 Tax=Helcococcus bovis TaxID=3153252 RepID=A0ABW9F6Q8_9FIRM